MAQPDLLTFTARGTFCPDGDFFIDPLTPVERAIITHGHSDHARAGHQSYLCHSLTAPVLRLRLGSGIHVQPVEYGEKITFGNLTVSLHPAGHIPGSAQIRIERAGEVWVAAGDYKLHPDGVSTPFEPIRCHAFITESTFGLPVYRWPSPFDTKSEINTWWSENRATGKTSVLTGYSLGKAQRLLSLLDLSIGPVFVHSAIAQVSGAFREQGLPLPEAPVWTNAAKQELRGAMVLLPPGAATPGTLRKLAPISIAHASGWMAIRGNKRRLALDRGFIVSDHADWSELNQAIAATGADRIFVTHGQIVPLTRWLNERGYQASAVPTRFENRTRSESGETDFISESS